jgi:hypothetical protein
MSSILRALKKLEDAPSVPDNAAPWQERFSNQHSRHGEWRRHPLRTGPAIMAAVAILLIVGWLASRGPQHEQDAPHKPPGNEQVANAAIQPSPSPPPASVPASPEPSTADRSAASLPPALVERPAAAHQQTLAAAHTDHTAARAPVTRVPRSIPPSPAVISPPVGSSWKEAPHADRNLGAANTGVKPVTTPLRESVSPVVKSPPFKDPKDPGEASTTTPRASLGSPPVVGPPLQRDTSQPATAAAKRIPPTRKRFPAARAEPTKEAAPPAPVVNRLRDSAVKLQAIAWSSDPARRMAMINELIVQEGQTIGGYTVATIGEESVTVRKGSKTWELRYGH